MPDHNQKGEWQWLGHDTVNAHPYLEFLSIFNDEFNAYRFDMNKVIPDGEQEFQFIYGQNGTFVLNEDNYINSVNCHIYSADTGNTDWEIEGIADYHPLSCCSLMPDVDFNNNFSIEIRQDLTMSGITSILNGGIYGTSPKLFSGMGTVTGISIYTGNATDIRFMTADGQDMTDMEVTAYGLLKSQND
ncbi:MAG: hypothetical protein V3V84_08375 [Candidatus Bathyarchaeia archaeon]